MATLGSQGGTLTTQLPIAKYLIAKFELQVFSSHFTEIVSNSSLVDLSDVTSTVMVMVMYLYTLPLLLPLTLHLTGLQDSCYSLFQYGESTKSSRVQFYRNTHSDGVIQHFKKTGHDRPQRPPSQFSYQTVNILTGVMIAFLIHSCLTTVTTCSRYL